MNGTATTIQPTPSDSGVPTSARQKKIGPELIRPDKVADEDPLAKLAAAVATGDKERVFVVAAQIVAACASASDTEPVQDDGCLLTIKDVAHRLRLGVRTVDRFLADSDSDFPRPQRHGHQRRWHPDQISAYVAKKWNGTP